MARKRRLLLEVLEARIVPATELGVPWIYPQHLTLSFVPDGTQASGATSSLQQLLNADFPTGNGELQILQAFQTWAVLGNVNIGLVGDGGQAMGTPGAVQGDPRFGDIRLGAQPLGNNAVATGDSFQLDGSTWSGDVLFNSADLFGSGPGAYDLFTVALHEAGHVFGMPDNSDPTSAMFSNYNGPKTGPNTQDIAAFQSLYGTRQPDAFEGKAGNNTWQTATALGSFATPITADISSLNDQDYFKFTVPQNVTPGSTRSVQVNAAGLSLLMPSVTVYDSSQNVLGSAAAASPLANDLSVQVQNVTPGEVLYAEVGNATQSVFGIGAYQLSLSTQANTTSPQAPASLLGAVNRNNTSFATATRLTARNASSTTLDYSYQGNHDTAGESNYFLVHSPTTATGAPQEMIALVSGGGITGLAPRVDVYDAAGNPVAAQVIGNTNGFYSVEIPNAASNVDYYIQVSALNPSGSRNVGGYLVGIDFNATPSVSLQSFGGGILTASAPQESQTLQVSQAGALQLILGVDAGGATGVEVQMTILDASGNQVFQLTSWAGQPASTGVAYLTPGTYTVVYSLIAPNGAPPPSVSWSIQGWAVSDPIGPTLIGSTSTSTTTTSTTTLSSGGSMYLSSSTMSYLWSSPSYTTLGLTSPYTTPYYY